jgi:hypothetical protein
MSINDDVVQPQSHADQCATDVFRWSIRWRVEEMRHGYAGHSAVCFAAPSPVACCEYDRPEHAGGIVVNMPSLWGTVEGWA